MTSKEIKNILKDYHWMINSIRIMRQSLESAGDGITAQYGIESVMPKAKGGTGDPVHREVIRRSRHWKRVQNYEEKVKDIQERIHLITDDRELEVLHWLLEGKSYRWIALHMGLSHSHIRRIKESIVEQMTDQDVPNVPKGTKLKKEKCAV